MPDLIHHFEQQLKHHSAKRYLIAYSGGLDSRVLLHLAQQSNDHFEFIAVHINHALSPNADAWQLHCEEQSKQSGIPIQSIKVTVQQQGGGLESAAREARYEAFESLLLEDDVLLLAHHQDDQLETFFLRLFRGAGLHGLTGMPDSRVLGKGRLVRPLLDISKQQILDYAALNNLSWIEDESNQDDRFDRNYIRSQLMPIIRQRWPNNDQVLARNISLLRQASNRLTEDTGLLLAECSAADGSLMLGPLQHRDSTQQNEVIRQWLQGFGLPLPSAAVLAQISGQMLNASLDASPVIDFNGYSLQRYQGHLYAVNLIKHPQADRHLEPGQKTELNSNSSIELNYTTATDDVNFLRADLIEFEVRFQVPAFKTRLEGRNGGRDRKRLIQELNIRPWLRKSIPYIYSDGQLVAIADKAIVSGFAAKNGEPAIAIRWICHDLLERNKRGS